jgi:Mg-chelatase subunit ChlD
VFNLVLFASDVETWNDDLVTMDPDARAQVAEFVEKQEAVGGTNIYGSLERALDLAGTKGGNQWSKTTIDTIYVLTDGKASVGLTTDTEEILAFVRERNKTAGITIHTIGLSNAHDPVLLRRLAEENGGSYVGR